MLRKRKAATKGKETTKRRNAGQRRKIQKAYPRKGTKGKKRKKETARRKKGEMTKKAIETKRRKLQENVEKRKLEKKVLKMKKKTLVQNKRADIYTGCEAQFLNYSRLNQKKARSIERQVSRINQRSSALKKKQVKQGDFKKTYEILRMVLGGNESDLECNGEPVNATTRGTLLKL